MAVAAGMVAADTVVVDTAADMVAEGTVADTAHSGHAVAVGCILGRRILAGRIGAAHILRLIQ